MNAAALAARILSIILTASSSRIVAFDPYRACAGCT
jgi:hypothetical protein